MYSYFGLCPNAKESLILFEAVKKGIIPTVSDRLSEEERKEIVSGAIYIWDEKQNPVRRWTDGMTWSNSRVVGDFLEYRESFPDSNEGKHGKYTIKPFGLRKRSICFPVNENSSLRLIAYFTCTDLKMGNLVVPSKHPAFQGIVESLDKNPHLEECLALLASGKRRKRTKYLKFGRFSKHEVPSPPPSPSKLTEQDIIEHHQKIRSGEYNTGSIHYSELGPSLRTLRPRTDLNTSSGNYRENHQPAPNEYFFQSPHQPLNGNLLSIYDSEIQAYSTSMSTVANQPQTFTEHFNANQVLQSSTLPSPVWVPVVLNSEDRRALQLLNASSYHMATTP